MCWGLTKRQPLWVILCHLSEKGKRDRRDNRRDEREEQGRKRNSNESEETEEITRNVSTVHGCPHCRVPDYKTAKFYLVQMP